MLLHCTVEYVRMLHTSYATQDVTTREFHNAHHKTQLCNIELLNIKYNLPRKMGNVTFGSETLT